MGFKFSKTKKFPFRALCLVATSLFLLSGCGKEEVTKIQAPYPNGAWRNQDYQEVESAFRNAGFANIVLLPKATIFHDDDGNVTSLIIDPPGLGYYNTYNEHNLFSLDSVITIEYTEAPEPAATPEPTATPEPIVYTTDSESLAALFEETSFGSVSEIQAQYIPESGLVSIVYNIDEALTEKDLCSKAFLNYVRFVQALAAYQVDGVSEVSVCTQFPTTDSYGNKDITPVLSWSMTMESFQQYNWKNLRLREGVFIQFSNDCESFWVAPFMENTVDWNEVMLLATFELEE